MAEEKRQSAADAMKISILASGSTGNVTYIETPQHKVLVDAGLSGIRIERLMNSIGRTLKDVDSIFVSHEHSDHCKGVGVLARRYGMDVYANAKTWAAMAHKVGEIPIAQKHIFATDETLSLGDLDVESFGVSHDAADPQFYALHHNDHSLVVLTDTGYVSDYVAGTIQNADAYLVECNHDPEMLRMGPYPWSLKQRIIGDTGHLSNAEGADALMQVLGDRTKRIYLGHRSQHNNLRELAHGTVHDLLLAHDYAVDHDFQLYDTEPDKATELTIL